ncbi:hypothetical protein C0J52_07176 [Blattella germanica]|nr:hypothetical protein C0J52_07176 [Blattella germanica]
MCEVPITGPRGLGSLSPLTRSVPDLPQLTDREQQLILEVLQRDEQLRRQDQIRVIV